MKQAWPDYYAVVIIDADGNESLYIADIGLMVIDEPLWRLALNEVVDIWAEIFSRPYRSIPTAYSQERPGAARSRERAP